MRPEGARHSVGRRTPGTGWASSDRRSRLPADWARRRVAVLARAGHRCEAVDSLGARCDEHATDCDHVERGDDHRAVNLQALCRWHHNQKTAREAAEARRTRPTRRREPESHPGLLVH